MKAIEILFYGINTQSKLFQHFLESYKKNYNFNLHMIAEEEEPSMTSVKNSEYYREGFIYEMIQKNPQVEESLKKIIENKKYSDIKHLKSVFQN